MDWLWFDCALIPDSMAIFIAPYSFYMLAALMECYYLRQEAYVLSDEEKQRGDRNLVQ